MFRRAALLLTLLFSSCDSGEPNKVTQDDYEGPVAEAAVRHLIAHLPPLDPEVPKVYCIVKGPHLENTHMSFAGRMKDLNLRFVSGIILKVRESDRNVYDPDSGLSPVTLQISQSNRVGTDTYEVVAGWAYMKKFERRQYKMRASNGGYEVIKDERIEGNFTPSS